jgi:acetoin utilization deacetylase AcuC-like enzyme
MRKRERDIDELPAVAPIPPPAPKKLELFVRRWQAEVSPTSELNTLPAPQWLRGPSMLSKRTSVVPRLGLHALSRKPSANRWTAPSGTCLGYDERMLLHRTADNSEVERPARIEVTFGHLTSTGLAGLCSRAPVSAAQAKDLLLVHTREHLEHLEQLGFVVELSRSGQAMPLPEDSLYVCADTPHAARISCGIVIECTKEVLAGRAQNAFALVRPPGHHCSGTRASGFCFFNNVAVAVRVAQRELMKQRPAELTGPKAQKPRMMIIDWDVHHCDGTESIFYADPSVLVFSVHQYGSKKKHAVLRRSRADQAVQGSESSDHSVGVPVIQKVDEGYASEVDAAELLSALNGDDLDSVAPDNFGAAPDDAERPLSAPANAESAAEPHRPRRERPAVNYAELAKQVTDQEAAEFAKKLTGIESADSDDDEDEEEGDNEESTESFVTDSERDNKDNHGECKYAGDTEGTSCDSQDNDTASPFYPCTGHADRLGEPDVAEGLNVNFPWPTTGFGDLEYYLVLQELCGPLIRQFQPEMIFVSCGFDCAQHDLLGSMNVSPTGFYFMMKYILSLHEKVVVALEGGYNITSVALSSEAVLRALLEATTDNLPPSRMLAQRCLTQIAHVQSLHKKHWTRLGLTED